MTTELPQPHWLMPWQSYTALSTVSISTTLSRICRYCGRTPHWYSVARHSRLVVHLLPAEATLTQKKWALLHDAHEMWINDLPRPFEEALTDPFRQEIRNIREEMDTRIQALMGINVSALDRETVQIADDHACELEKSCLALPDSAVFDLMPDSPEAAYELTVLGRPELDAADWRQMWEALSSEAA